jgi:hypothetical protein
LVLRPGGKESLAGKLIFLIKYRESPLTKLFRRTKLVVLICGLTRESKLSRKIQGVTGTTVFGGSGSEKI